MDETILAPLKPCLNPGCSELVAGSRCPKHAKSAERHRGNSAERGYDSDWKRIRLRVLKRDLYTCRIRIHCNGARATEVDHIRPIGVFPEGRLQMSNLQAACKPCNAAKGARFQLRGEK
jgi:5-methylcytosine-specific restriction protein A